MEWNGILCTGLMLIQCRSSISYLNLCPGTPIGQALSGGKKSKLNRHGDMKAMSNFFGIYFTRSIHSI